MDEKRRHRPTQSGDPPVQVVGAAIIREARCLLAQRSEAMTQPLKWEFPGGKVEHGEGPRAALRREIREELGIEIRVGPRLGSSLSVISNREIELHVYLATMVGGIVEAREHLRWGWHSADELDRLEWAAADLPLVEPLEQHLLSR